MDTVEELPQASSTPKTPQVYCECVRYLREVLGINIRGNANTLQPNVTDPQVDDVVLLSYDGIDHAALIVGMGYPYLFIKETNFKKCRPTERKIRVDDPEVRGYIRLSVSI